MNATKPSQAQPAATPPEVKPNTGQGAEPTPAAVGAGPGNQLLDNATRAVQQEAAQTDLKPGAQPDGTASNTPRQARNEGVEQTDEAEPPTSIE